MAGNKLLRLHNRPPSEVVFSRSHGFNDRAPLADNRDWTQSRNAAHPPGHIAAIGIVATGLFQLVKAIKLGFLKHLDPADAHKTWIAWTGRAGYAARAAIFIIVGWFLWNAARHARAAEAGGTEQAMSSLPEGLRAMVAAGFVLFGIFSLIEARYRRINNPNVLSRLK